MSKLGFHATQFSDKVRMMNDANSKNLTMTASEARNLHADIFALLAKIAGLADGIRAAEDSAAHTRFEVQGGKF